MAVEIKKDPDAHAATLPPVHREQVQQAEVKFARRKKQREDGHE